MVKNTPSPRIIFVSGSSLYYGLDSKRVADSLHVNVVNYGLHAGIGLRYWLDEITPLVHKGDLVVLAPEYFQFFNDNMDGSEGVLAPHMYYSNLCGIEHFNANQMLKVIKGIPIMIGQNAYNYALYDMRGEKRGPYDYMNNYGDHSGHWSIKKSLNLPPTEKTSVDSIPNAENIDYFCMKINQMKRQGANVLIVPGLITQTGFEANRFKANGINNALKEYGFSYCSAPELHVFPDSMAYDSHYHLLWSGVCRNTEIIINDIKASGLCPR